MTTTSSPRTTTPPAENSRLPTGSEDVSFERCGVMDCEPATALADDSRALEHGEEAARGTAGGAPARGGTGPGRGGRHTPTPRPPPPRTGVAPRRRRLWRAPPRRGRRRPARCPGAGPCPDLSSPWASEIPHGAV